MFLASENYLMTDKDGDGDSDNKLLSKTRLLIESMLSCLSDVYINL